MNHYFASDGTRYSKAEIDRRTSAAKAEKRRLQKEEHGYNFCEICNNNECWPVDASHNTSVNEAQKSGRCELAWDLNNITMRGRRCHQKYDGLDLKFKNTE